ncbi:DUF2726 domain-containing protein (plasmid) [Citrobacter cronae]|uniref:DUF2726 domain-containing protein n=1 Tax=Enterobacteriaceae TaxID=543 RepID=UPI0021825872|nr:DUF2726 domain-containing protein [Citrobacter freundii]UVD61985.1 hypothetical protein [Citrobacter freundii]
MRLLMCVLVVGAFLFLLWHFTRTGRGPDSALVRELAAAGVTPGESEKLLGSGHHWRAQRALMTDREVYFMHDLFREVDMQRWYLCPQVRVADIVELSPHIRPRSKMWWRLFNMAAQWHCDVVIVDRRTFAVVAAIELDDASHLKKSRVKRDILLNEVMRQANVPLLRNRDSKALLKTVSDFLNTLTESTTQKPH